MSWKLTVRHGSRVRHERFDSLDEAVAVLEREAEAVRAEGPLKKISSLRDFEPAEQVAARLEISGKGLLRPPTAGVDVKGDGSVVPFSGGVMRSQLEPEHDSAYDAVRDALQTKR